MPSAAEPISLRRFLTSSYALLLLLGMLALCVGVYCLVQNYLWRSGEWELHRKVIDVVRRAQPRHHGARQERRWAALTAPPELPRAAQHLAEAIAEPGMFAVVYSSEGQVLGQAGRYVPPLTPPRPEAADRSLLVEGERGPWQVRLVPLLGERGVTATVAVGSSFRRAQDLLAILARYLLLVGAATIFLVWAVSAWLAARLARPLETLSEAARKVAAGDLGARSRLHRGTEEMIRLSGAFDAMVERLGQSLVAQKRFVADASHELKTPITAIGGMTEMLRRGADQRPEDRELALSTIERETERMSRLVADLLALSRAEQAAPAPLEEVALKPLLEEVAEYVRLAQHPVTLECPEGLTAWGRRDALSRVLHNLADNAVKYSAENQPVELKAASEGGRVVVRVTDRGIGISAEDLEHVFERFYRADPARARGTGGTGLGLSIVAALVASMEGTVRLESELGEGTTAVIKLRQGS